MQCVPDFRDSFTFLFTDFYNVQLHFGFISRKAGKNNGSYELFILAGVFVLQSHSFSKSISDEKGKNIKFNRPRGNLKLFIVQLKSVFEHIERLFRSGNRVQPLKVHLRGGNSLHAVYRREKRNKDTGNGGARVFTDS